jgi:hypothetical protein
MTRFVIATFRLRHTLALRHVCRCWICKAT